MKRSLLLLGVIAALAIGAPAYSQYIWMDVNGDGVNTSADVLTSSVTSIHVYLDTDNVKGGGAPTATCGGNPLDIGLFDVLFRSSGTGSVTYNGFNLGSGMTGFAVLNAFTVQGTDAGVGYTGPNYLPPGTYELGQLQVTITGTPIISFLPEAANQATMPSPNTAFGSHCDGSDHPNYITLNVDFFDADGTASTTDTQETTWGKIKKLYR